MTQSLHPQQNPKRNVTLQKKTLQKTSIIQWWGQWVWVTRNIRLADDLFGKSRGHFLCRYTWHKQAIKSIRKTTLINTNGSIWISVRQVASLILKGILQILKINILPFLLKHRLSKLNSLIKSWTCLIFPPFSEITESLLKSHSISRILTLLLFVISTKSLLEISFSTTTKSLLTFMFGVLFNLLALVRTRHYCDHLQAMYPWQRITVIF